MSAFQKSTGLAVIGGGPGGYAAAFLAADLGMQVSLVDPEPNPGGVCLYRGCIPSKALLHVAKLVHETRQATEWGVTFGEPVIDLDRLRAWKDDVVGKLTGGLGQLTARRKVEHVRGRAVFQDARTLSVETADGGGVLGFEHAIVATGSRPVRLPFLPDSPRVLDSTTALDLPDVPGRLLVIGGGYIGLELGGVYAALGSRVTVVEMESGLLPGADRDLVAPLAKRMERELEAIWLQTRVASAEDTGSAIRVRFEGKGPVPEAEFDRVLVAVGRRPNSEGLGLEHTDAVVNDRGFIEVDRQLRTAEPTVFAIGDVVGQPMLAHKASHEGRTAVEVIAGHPVVFEPAGIPAVVFTDPELAWVGLTEGEAAARGIAVEIAKFPWAASGRAMTLGAAEGVTKLLADPESRRVLGVGICGSGAGELIAEATLALEMGARVDDLKLTIHAHPTLSETVMESAEVFFGQSTHVYRPKRG
jgi:dihydrolipoamide dehydrogenase